MANIGDLFFGLFADGSHLEADIKRQAEAAAAKAGASAGKTLGSRMAASASTALSTLAKTGSSLQATGRSLTQDVTVPILAAGAAVVKVGTDFDTTLRRIVALTDTTAEEIGGVREQILKLATEVGKSPEELAQGFYFLASAGFNTAEAMKVLEATAKASAVGLGTTADVSKVVGAAINAFGKDNLTASDAVDQLLRAIKDGTAEAPDFAESLGQVVSTAGAMGVTFADTTAAMAAMTLKGQDADTAATNLNQVLVSLLKPTKEAEDTLNGLGLSSAGLRQEIKDKGLLAVLQTLETAFGNDETAAAKVFGNVRALRGVLALVTGDAQQVAGVFDDVAHGTANLGDAFKTTEGPGREFDRTMADVQEGLIELSTDVLPVFVQVLHGARDVLHGVVGAFEGLPQPVRSGVVQFLALAAAIGPATFVLGTLAKTAARSGQAVLKLAGFAGKVATALKVPQIVQGFGSAIVSGFEALAGSSAVKGAVDKLGSLVGSRLGKGITAGIGIITVAAVTIDYVAAQKNAVDLINQITRDAGKASLDQLLQYREQLQQELAKQQGNFDPLEDFFGLSQQGNVQKELDAINAMILQAQFATDDARESHSKAALEHMTANEARAGDAITKTVTGTAAAATAASKLTDEQIQKLSDDATKAAENVLRQNGTIRDAVKAAAALLPEELRSKLPEIRQSAIEMAGQIGEGLLSQRRNLKSDIDAFWHTFETTWSNKKTRAYVLGQLTAHNWIKAFNDNRPGMQDAALAAFNELITEGQKAGINFGKLGGKAGKAYAKFLRLTGADIADAGKKGGKKGSQGVADGLDSKVPAVRAAALDILREIKSVLATTVTTTINTTLKIAGSQPGGKKYYAAGGVIPAGGSGFVGESGLESVQSLPGGGIRVTPLAPRTPEPSAPPRMAPMAARITEALTINGGVHLHGVGSDVSPAAARRFSQQFVEDASARMLRIQGARRGISPAVRP